VLLILTMAAVAGLAFANGSNDVSKGIATLAGSRRATYRQALAWGTLWTALGAFGAVAISFGLVKAFTSAMVTAEVLATPTFPLAVASSAAAWVLFSSMTGLPVSTTHALTGALVGVALGTGGSDSVQWSLLLAGVLAPLALSPLASATLAYGAHNAAVRTAPACMCVDDQLLVSSAQPKGTLVATPARSVFTSAAGCSAEQGRVRLTAGPLMHWGASAALSFARGVNDSPKIAALGTLVLASGGMGVAGAFVVTALAMTLGSFVAGFRVSRTLGERVVTMDTNTGLAGAVVAAGLVLAASIFTLPVSTTHVSTGAIVGAGFRQGGDAVRWGTVASLVSAWLITLPVCGGLGAGFAWAAHLWGLNG